MSPMLFRLRPPFEGRLALRRFWATLLFAATVACGSTPETSLLDDSLRTPPSNVPAPTASETSCAPNVSGLVPARIEPANIHCPRGYAQRASFAALPIAGRFTTLDELTNAFCIEKTSPTMPVDPRGAPTADEPIDFEKNDVVAYAFDRRAGVEPVLFERGIELWLRMTTTTCTGEAPELASVAFVVPKGTKINEQKCSLRCE